MKAIILARVSTEEQMNEGQSIPAQLDRARNYAKSREMEIMNEYQFEESSTKDKRKKYDEVIAEIKKSKEPIALIIECVDRLQRDFKESVLLDDLRKDGKIELHFLRENLIIHRDSNSAEILRWDMAVMFAKSYVLQISDNVKRTFDKKIKNGEITGLAPVGYLNTDDGKSGKTVEPDPLKAPFVIKVFELYSTGNYSMQRIADMLSDEGFRSNFNKTIKVRTVEYILKNPFYYGFQLSKGQTYPHKYEPLISHELFSKCQNVIESYKKKPSKYTTKPFIFRGLMQCKKCGCAITAMMAKKKYIYYHCTNYKRNCEKVYIKEKDLLDPVLKVLKGLQLPQFRIDEITESLKGLEESKNKFHKDQLKVLREEYDRVDKRMSIMYDDRCDGRITTDMYDNKLKEYKEKQDSLLFKMKQFENANQNYYITANQVLSVARRAVEIFESSEPEEKRQFLNFLFQNLSLDGTKLLYKLKTPFDGVLSANTSTDCVVWGG
jgi:site-specific DNA recombinase